MFSTALMIGNHTICFYSNNEIYSKYLCELFSYRYCEKADINIYFNENLDNKSSDIINLYDDTTVYIQETRKKVLYKDRKISCEVNVPVKSAEAFYYTYVLPSVKICLGREQMVVIHSGFLTTPKGNSFVCISPSGGGKTTTSLILFHEGCSLLSDDLAFFDANDLNVYSFFRPMHVDYKLTATFDWLEPLLKNSKPYMEGSAKYNFDYRENDNLRYDLPAKLRTVFLPIIVDSDITEIKEISIDKAIYRILSQVYFDKAVGTESFEKLKSFLSGIKINLLLLGRDALMDSCDFSKKIIDCVDTM